MDIIDFQKLEAKGISSLILDSGDDNLTNLNSRINRVLKGDDAKLRNQRHALKRILFWDKCFYKEGKCGFSTSALCGRIKEHEFKDYVRELYFSRDEGIIEIMKSIQKVFLHWREMRNFIFEKDRHILEQCKKDKQLGQYVREQHYLEYILYAKYMLSLENNESFVEIEQALDFGDSEILPIEELKKLLCEVNGITFLFSREASKQNGESLRNCLIDLLETFEKTDDKIYIQKKPITYNLIKRLMANLERADENRYVLDYELYLHDNSVRQVTSEESINASEEVFDSLCGILNNLLSRCTVKVEYESETALYKSGKLIIITK